MGTDSSILGRANSFDSTSDPGGSSRPLRVLLLGPLEGRDPPSGDTSYIAALMDAPPRAVEYTSYAEALADGRVVVRGRRAAHGRRTVADWLLLIVRSLERLLRSSVMFREPTWFITCRAGEFDLIHTHLFGLRQIGTSPLPIVSSAGLPLPLFYRHRDGWSRPRLALARALELVWSRVLDVHNPWCRRSRSGVMTVYSQRFRDLLEASGIPSDKVLLAGTALPPLRARPNDDAERDRPTIAFIGRDYERKGGPVALGAFSVLAARHPDWRFLAITAAPSLATTHGPGGTIEVMPATDRDTLDNEVLPFVDVLVLPTTLDCGAPYTVMEALQMGASIVISPSPWLDDRLVGPAVEHAQPSPESVAAGIERAMSVPREERRAEARSLWERSFSMPGLHEDLARAYALALGQPTGAR